MVLGIDCSRYAANEPTGVEIYTDRIIEGLIRRFDELGYEKIKCYVKSSQQLEKLLGHIDQRREQIIQPVLIERKRLWTVFGLSWEMFRRPVDVLFVPSHTLPLIVPQRSVLTVHGVESFLFPRAYSWFQRYLQRSSLNRAQKKKTRLIAVSHAVKKDLIRFLSYPSKFINVVWNGYDARDDDLFERKMDSRRLVSGDFILSVGRLEQRKNQKRLVQAFESIADRFPELKLVLVGPDGFGAAEIHQLVSRSAVKDRIILAGYQHSDMVRDLFRHAKLFAYPSLAEGFGIPLLEAFSVGCPVLTARGSASEEIGADAVEYCDAESVESIARGLTGILNNPSQLEKQLKKAQKRLALFSWKNCIDGTLEVLESIRK